MKDETSLFGVSPERVDRLLRYGLTPPEGNGETVAAPALDRFGERPGGRIDRYQLLRVLGEGGMGIVYLAQQDEPVKRQVALKVIKPGMDSKRVLTRFEAEKQALALMDHPHIARVIDAGLTLSARPYFVMDYVKGLPITEFCDQHKLTIEERLRLFLHICHAVHHAHQKGIIHRDIKPSNILVTDQDGQTIPKIIDFGIAKALTGSLTEETLSTEHGQLFGTPEYMSPEQADLSTEDIDTRSDIYSLGVLLYVLLAGILPYDSQTFRQGGIEHIRRTIRETDPKTPSTRLARLGEEARKIAESRRTKVMALVKCLHKELEWIPLKAIRKERAERYRSASELADDIQNYLQGIALIAGPESALYRVRKFARRNQALVTGITVVLSVLWAGIVGITIFAIKAEQHRIETQAVSDLLQYNVLTLLEPHKVGGQDIAIRSVCDEISKGIEEEFEGTRLVEAEIRHAVGNAYWRLGLYKKAESHLTRAFGTRANKLGPKHLATLASANDLGWVYYLQGRHREAEPLISQACENRRHLLGDEHEDTLLSMGGLACVYILQARFHEADILLSNLAVNIHHVFGENHAYVVGLMNVQSQSYIGQGRYAEAERIIEEGLRIAHAHPVMGENHWFALLLNNAMATTYIRLGLYDKAERLLLRTRSIWIETWGKEHPDTLSATDSLAWVYHSQGRYEEAESLFDEVLKTAQRVLGNTHLLIPGSMYGLGIVYLSQERYDQSEQFLSQASDIGRSILDEKHPDILRIVNSLGVLHARRKQYEKAESFFDEALKGRKLKLGYDHPDTLETINDFGVFRREQEDYEKAEELLRRALDGRNVKLGHDHPHTLQSMHELAVLHVEKDRRQQAADLLVKVAEGRLVKLGDKHPHTQESLSFLIDLYKTLNQPEEAEKWRAKLAQTEAVED